MSYEFDETKSKLWFCWSYKI